MPPHLTHIVSQEYFQSELSWPVESILTSQTLQSYAVVGFLNDGNSICLDPACIVFQKFRSMFTS